MLRICGQLVLHKTLTRNFGVPSRLAELLPFMVVENP